MKKRSIFKATFEESLILEDDSFVQQFYKDVKRQENQRIREKPLLSIIVYTILIGILYGWTALLEFLLKNTDKDSPVPNPKVNFMTMELFWICLLIFIIIMVITNYKRSNNIRFFFVFVNLNNYLLWLMLNLNLFFLTLFLESLSLLGILTLIFLIIQFSYFIYKSKIKSLKNILFESDSKTNRIDACIQATLKIVFKYGWVAVIIIMIWKVLFPNTAGVRTDIVGFIGIITMWMAFNIGFIMMEVYVFLAYLLYGYYQYKYPEEYREWEGKTQLEWYGEKYFNKHIKGTEKEEKIND